MPPAPQSEQPVTRSVLLVPSHWPTAVERPPAPQRTAQPPQRSADSRSAVSRSLRQAWPPDWWWKVVFL